MEILTFGEVKTHFSKILKRVLAGEEIGISYGRKKEVVARIVPKAKSKLPKRKLGILEGRGSVKFSKDFSITETGFLGL